jgi:hypothetical protein
MLFCIEFERLKRLPEFAQRNRSIAAEKADLLAANSALETMLTLSDRMLDHALKCPICNATVTERLKR